MNFTQLTLLWMDYASFLTPLILALLLIAICTFICLRHEDKITPRSLEVAWRRIHPILRVMVEFVIACWLADQTHDRIQTHPHSVGATLVDFLAHIFSKPALPFLTAVLQYSLAFLVITYVLLLLNWMTVQTKSMVILPFENTTELKISGKSISDSLIAEMQRIRRIHEFQLPRHNTAKRGDELEVVSHTLSLTLLDADANEQIDASIKEIGTIGFGDAKFSVGTILLTMKKLWPLGDNGSYVAGSLQQYGDKIRLVARMEHRGQVWAWDVTQIVKDQADITDLICDMAYIITYVLSNNETTSTQTTAKTTDANAKTTDAKIIAAKITDPKTSEAEQTSEKKAKEKKPSAKDTREKKPEEKETSEKETVAAASPWQGFKYFTEARNSYRKFLWSDNDSDLHETYEHCLNAFAIEKSYEKCFNLGYNVAIYLLDRPGADYLTKAEQLLWRLIGLKPDHSKSWTALGLSYYRRGRYTEAEHCFLRAHDLEEAREKTRIEEFLEEAKQEAQQAATKAQVARQKAEHYSRQAQAAISQTVATRAAQQATNAATDAAHAATDAAEAATDATDAAHQALEAAKKKETQTKDEQRQEAQKKARLERDWFSTSNLALIYLNQMQGDKANEWIEKAIEGNSDFTWGHINYGLVQWQTGNYEAAEAAFERAIAQGLNGHRDVLVWAYCGKGISGFLRRRRDADGAEICRNFWNAIHSDPTFLPSYIYLVETYIYWGQIAEARNMMNSCHHLGPSGEWFFYDGLLKAFESGVGAAKESWEQSLSKCDILLPMNQFRRALWAIASDSNAGSLEDWQKAIRRISGEEKPPLPGLHQYARRKADLVLQMHKSLHEDTQNVLRSFVE